MDSTHTDRSEADAPEEVHLPPPTLRSSSNVGRLKCLECGAQATPQWREGPAGPKTLCNACGVRHLRNTKKQQRARQGPRQEVAQRKPSSKRASPASSDEGVLGMFEDEDEDRNAALDLLALAACSASEDGDAMAADVKQPHDDDSVRRSKRKRQGNCRLVDGPSPAAGPPVTIAAVPPTVTARRLLSAASAPRGDAQAALRQFYPAPAAVAALAPALSAPQSEADENSDGDELMHLSAAQLLMAQLSPEELQRLLELQQEAMAAFQLARRTKLDEQQVFQEMMQKQVEAEAARAHLQQETTKLQQELHLACMRWGAGAQAGALPRAAPLQAATVDSTGPSRTHTVCT